MQLKQASLSRVICDNADNISRVPMDAFVLQSVSEFVSCEEVPTVNLQLWQECPGEQCVCVCVCVTLGLLNALSIVHKIVDDDAFDVLLVYVLILILFSIIKTLNYTQLT